MLINDDDLPFDKKQFIEELQVAAVLLKGQGLDNVSKLCTDQINYIRLYYQAYQYPYGDNRGNTF